MRSVPTPIADVMEKYIFNHANSKLADEMSKRRTVNQVIGQDELMARRCDLVAGVCTPVSSVRPSSVRPSSTMTRPIPLVTPAASITPHNVYSHIPRS